MVFALPENLAPECYPMAWLLGSWRGFGMLGYTDIDDAWFVQESIFEHDGGPYLRQTSTIWLAGSQAEVSQAMPGEEGYQRLTKGQWWSTETAYWRAVPVAASEDDAATDQPAKVGAELEVMCVDPAGHLSLYVGAVKGPRIDLVTDAVVQTPTAVPLTAATRMYGLVQGDLLWTQDMAAFGQEMRPYLSARLTRVGDPALDGGEADKAGEAEAPGADSGEEKD